MDKNKNVDQHIIAQHIKDKNSILAVIYLTKLQNLINLPVMNCSMSSFPYFYFSNYILFDFPSSGLIFL